MAVLSSLQGYMMVYSYSMLVLRYIGWWSHTQETLLLRASASGRCSSARLVLGRRIHTCLLMFLSTLNNHDPNTLLSLGYWFVAWTMVPDFPMMVGEVGRVQEILRYFIKVCATCVCTPLP